MNLLSLLYLGTMSFASPATTTQTSESLGPVSVGEEFPIFGSRLTLNDEYFKFKALLEEDQTVIVSYFATWCGPCKVGLPIIEEVAQSNPSLTAVYIDLGDESVPLIQKMVDELQLTSTVVRDPYSSLGKRHGVVIEGQKTTLPKTFIVDSNGLIHTIFITEGEDFKEKLTTSINQSIKQTQSK